MRPISNATARRRRGAASSCGISAGSGVEPARKRVSRKLSTQASRPPALGDRDRLGVRDPEPAQPLRSAHGARGARAAQPLGDRRAQPARVVPLHRQVEIALLAAQHDPAHRRRRTPVLAELASALGVVPVRFDRAHDVLGREVGTVQDPQAAGPRPDEVHARHGSADGRYLRAPVSARSLAVRPDRTPPRAPRSRSRRTDSGASRRPTGSSSRRSPPRS